MYADLVEAAPKRSVKDRLNGNVVDDSVCRRLLAVKRQRQDDDKWQHDLHNDNEPRVSSSRAQNLDARDLRLKLQKKTTSQQAHEQSRGVSDLRDMLSGSVHSQLVNADPQKPKPVPVAIKYSQLVNADPPKPKPVPLAIKLATKSTAKAPVAVPKTVAVKEKTKQKGDSSVEAFLHSLGLEKYQIQFQAEEVDMTALKHMTDEDFRAMGIPMGPRKKILQALSSKG